MKDASVARKYAAALFAEAAKENQLLACQQGLQEIARIGQLRASLVKILEHPFVSLNEKTAMIHSALGEFSTPLLEQFLMILVQKRRFSLLPTIMDEFQKAVDRHQNIHAVEVKVAYPLEEPQRAHLQKSLEQWLKGKVRMNVHVDPQLIGGCVIQTDEGEYDQSIRGQLKRLQRQLLAAS